MIETVYLTQSTPVTGEPAALITWAIVAIVGWCVYALFS